MASRDTGSGSGEDTPSAVVWLADIYIAEVMRDRRELESRLERVRQAKLRIASRLDRTMAAAVSLAQRSDSNSLQIIRSEMQFHQSLLKILGDECVELETKIKNWTPRISAFPRAKIPAVEP